MLSSLKLCYQSMERKGLLWCCFVSWRFWCGWARRGQIVVMVQSLLCNLFFVVLTVSSLALACFFARDAWKVWWWTLTKLGCRALRWALEVCLVRLIRADTVASETSVPRSDTQWKERNTSELQWRPVRTPHLRRELIDPWTLATLMLQLNKAWFPFSYNSLVCFTECRHIVSKQESFKLKTKWVFSNKPIRVRGKWLFFQQQAFQCNTY